MFDVSYSTIVPAIMDKEQLLDSNAKLGLARSVSELGGPELGGILVQALTAGTAVVVDAASFLFSGIAISMMKPRPVPRPPADATPDFFREMAAGVRAVLGHEIRRLIIGRGGAVEPVLLPDPRGVHPPRRPIARRVAVAARAGVRAGGPGFHARRHAGAGRRASDRRGPDDQHRRPHPPGGPRSPAWPPAASSTIMQTVTLREILGRVNSVASVIYRSTLPLGGLLGGILGDQLGMRTTVYIGALGLASSAGLLVLRPVRTFRIPKKT